MSGVDLNDWQRTKILVVDDRKENLFAMEQILKSLDCDIYMAHSGNDALSYTLRHDFALILLDVNMPEMDGFELAELLRDMEETKQIPIIFVTAINKEDKSVFKGYESGAVDYLFKPVDVDILLSKVKVFLELNAKKRELEAMQAELRRSNESLQQFASVASHDLKNPLNVIAGLSELVLARHSDGMSDKGKECMRHIVGAAERMNRMITDLLTYAQLNALPAHFVEVDLNAVVQEVTADLAGRIAMNGGEVQLHGELPVVEADRTLIYQLFQNLIGNAVKYRHKEREPLVRIMYNGGSGNGFCVIVIADNGIGMKREEIPTIFSPFKRLDAAKGYEGTGLGLATVQRIIDLHRGSIAVDSEPGVGTTVRVTLPMSQA